jgi:hypothetical protein
VLTQTSLFIDNDDLVFHLQQQRAGLLYLGAVWHQDASNMGPLTRPSYWGATDSQFQNALHKHQLEVESPVYGDGEGSDSSGSSVGVEGLEDHFLQLLEEVNLDDCGEPDVAFGFDDLFKTSTTPQASPRKRARDLDSDDDNVLL